MKRYSQFVEDAILESALNESVVYYSPKLRALLNKTGTNVAQYLLDTEYKDIKDDATFIDVSDKDGFLTFTQAKKIKKLFNDLEKKDYATGSKGLDILFYKFGTEFDSPAPSDDGHYWQSFSDLLYADEFGLLQGPWNYARSEVRIGKLVNTLLGGRFSFTQADVEKFVNRFKAVIEGKTETFELVKGDEIAFWYKEQNYYEMTHTLGSSCMRGKTDDIFRIYTNNPQVCQMLCVFDLDQNGEKKLKARALVWKVEGGDGFDTFMDRQYTISDVYVEKMRNWAKERGWALRAENSIHNPTSVEFGGKTFRDEFMVSLGSWSGSGNYDYGYYPYCDTFKRYDQRNGKLYNYGVDDYDYAGQYLLTTTSGRPNIIEDEDEHDGQVWSDYEGEWIDEDEAVYSEYLDTHLYSNNAVEVERGSYRYRGYWPNDHDDIVFSDRDDQYYHINDSVYSDIYESNIFASEAIRCITGIDGLARATFTWVSEDDDDFTDLSELKDYDWYKFMQARGRFEGERPLRVRSEELFELPDGSLIPRDLLVGANVNNYLFRVKQDQGVDIEFLTISDAILLDIKLVQTSKDQLPSSGDLVYNSAGGTQQSYPKSTSLDDEISYHKKLYEADLDKKLSEALNFSLEKIEELIQKRLNDPDWGLTPKSLPWAFPGSEFYKKYRGSQDLESWTSERWHKLVQFKPV